MLRFFKDKSVREVAEALHVNEAAAQRRVLRAMEKLRRFFAKRGVNSTAAIIGEKISAHSVQAAPAALAKSITLMAAAKGAAASGSTLTLAKGALKIMAWTKTKTVVVVGVLLAVAGGTAVYEASGNSDRAGSPAEMKIKWAVGKKYQLRMELSQSAEATPQPAEQGLKWAQEFNISVLKELPDGGRQLELEFVSQAMNVLRAGRSLLSFDSTQNLPRDTRNRLAILSALVGARLEYFTDADGKVQTVEGANELADHITAVGTPQQREVFQGMFSGDTLKNYLSLGEMMPNRTINVGESWSVKRDIEDAIGVLTVNQKFTFKNWEQHDGRKCAHIEQKGDISSKTVSANSGTAVKIQKGKISSDLWFDPELGLPVGENENEDLTMKITNRAQTTIKHTKNESRWTLVEVQ
jgi:hypothetical protein